MTMSVAEKADVAKKFARVANDTGAPKAPTFGLTARITGLMGHFSANKKDHHSRRGLLKMVNRRRSLLDYLKGKDEGRYLKLIGELGLRR